MAAPSFINDPSQVQIGGSSLLGWINSFAVAFGVPVGIAQNLIAQEDPTLQFDRRGTSGEIGLAQVLPTTALDVDPQGNFNLNNPLDNLAIGFKYLGGLFKQYGSWNAALQAYNSGSPTGSPGYASSVMNGLDPTYGVPLSIGAVLDPALPVDQSVSGGNVVLSQTNAAGLGMTIPGNLGPAAFDPKTGIPTTATQIASTTGAPVDTSGPVILGVHLPGWPNTVKYGFAALVVIAAIVVGFYVMGKSELAQATKG